PNGNVYVADIGALTLGGANASAGDYSVTANGVLTITAATTINATDVTLRSINNDLQINGIVNGSNSVTLHSHTGLFNANFGAVTVINPPDTTLISDIGSLGSNVTRLTLDLNNVNFSPPLGSVFFADPNNLVINNANFSAIGVVDVQANNNLTV